MEKDKVIKHEKSYAKLYTVHANIKQRCLNPKNNRYKDYGGRGIKICDEWLNDFMKFYNWSMNNGYKEGLSIDRIDNNGNYEPNNCRWVSNKIQSNNIRTNVILEFNNEKHTISEWAEKLNMKSNTIYARYERGWDVERILNKKATKSKAVNQYDLQNNFIKRWNSIKEAEKELDIKCITECCKGKLKTSGRYKWKYCEE